MCVCVYITPQCVVFVLKILASSILKCVSFGNFVFFKKFRSLKHFQERRKSVSLFLPHPPIHNAPYAPYIGVYACKFGSIF